MGIVVLVAVAVLGLLMLVKALTVGLKATALIVVVGLFVIVFFTKVPNKPDA